MKLKAFLPEEKPEPIRYVKLVQELDDDFVDIVLCTAEGRVDTNCYLARVRLTPKNKVFLELYVSPDDEIVSVDDEGYIQVITK